MGAIVIHDQMHFQMLRHLSVDVVEEFSEFSRAMPAKTFAHDTSGGDVQRGEERCRPMTLILGGVSFDLDRAHR